MISRKNFQALVLIVASINNCINAREGDGAREQYPDVVGPVRTNTQCCIVTNFGLRNFSDYADSQGKRYWDVTNNTDGKISLESDRQEIKLNPGKTKRLYRYNDYTIDVKNESGNAIAIITDNHAVSIVQNAANCLYYATE